MKTIIKTIAVFFIAFTLSCSKDVPGPQGEQGPQGLKGEQGEQGPKGTADIKSYEFLVEPTEFMWDDIGKQWYYNWYINIPDSSMIAGYCTDLRGKYVMPFENGQNGAIFTFAKNFHYTPAYIRIIYYKGTAQIPRPSAVNLFEFIVISPAFVKANPNFDYSDYNKVSETLNFQ